MSPYLPEAPPQPIQFYQVQLVPLDDVNPDTLRAAISSVIHGIEQRSEAELVAMDWGTLEIKTQTRRAPLRPTESHLAVIATVQALP